MKRTRWALPALLASLGAAALGGCEGRTTLDTRTFPLENLYGGEAEALVRPYVFDDREGAPGSMSSIEGALTVRETPDNLEKIERVLAEYDLERADVRLRFQLVEADGAGPPDPRIAEVEEELRGLFHFDGYRLIGEAFVTASDRSEILQGIGGAEAPYEIRGRAYWVQAGTLRLEEVSLQGRDALFSTTVNIRPGQTLVLGSSTRMQEGTTLFLVVTAETPGGE